MKASSTFSTEEDLTRITLGSFDSSLKRHVPIFLMSPTIVLRSTRDTQNWTPGLKDSLCKTVGERFSGNSSSRHSSKVTSKLRSHCPPMSSCA
ncbi:hypothetical protein TNCV_841221 [Trichonephila clavipes]|nr:hypothetical protein TNCV_841221 [Trichonephila clavipes]